MKRALVLALCVVLAAAPGALAQAPEARKPPADGPRTYDFRDGTSAEMAVWINDPNVHAFYQATVDAFAQGPDHLDRAAYEKRAQEIFRALALAHNIKPEALEDHLKAIPGEMVLIVTRDPRTLDSYDNFVLALFGPQPR